MSSDLFYIKKHHVCFPAPWACPHVYPISIEHFGVKKQDLKFIWCLNHETELKQDLNENESFKIIVEIYRILFFELLINLTCV